MRTPYYPDESKRYYKKYYEQQIGGNMDVFQGSTVQRGRGIGKFLKAALKATAPLLKTGAKTVGRELMSTGVGLAKDALAGRDMKQAAEERFKAAGSNALDSFISGNRPQPRPRPKKRKRPPPSQKQNKKQRRGRKSRSVFENVNVSTSR